MIGLADPRPVFVVGAPRSGTTLVYSLLLASDEFPLYEEGETRLLQCRSRYGPLGVDQCHRRFMDDWMASDQFRRSGLVAAPFRRGAERHRGSYVEFLRFFMAEMCRFHGKQRWAEKTPANIYHMQRLAREFPSARFVHVIRDGRDVALSRRKLGWNVVATDDPERQLLAALKHWEQLVRIGRRAGAALGDRYLEVRYEDIVRHSEDEIGRLAAFTRADIPTRVEADRQVGALERGFSAYDQQLDGISAAALERWRAQLTSWESVLAEISVGDTLRELGYPMELRTAPLPLRWRVQSLGGWYRVLISLRRGIRDRTPLWLLRQPQLLDYGGSPGRPTAQAERSG